MIQKPEDVKRYAETTRPDENNTILQDRNSGFWVRFREKLTPWTSLEAF